ncbi:MAG TPA: hypothetical protein VG651_18810 [Stellaceae bacterium]|nr:hypothetical protein [Stellaceae bacterium]
MAGTAMLGGAGPAAATGVAGDRLFPSTLLIEDTQDDDEIALPTIGYLRRGTNGDTTGGRDLSISTEYSRLLTPDLSALIGTGWHRLSGAGATRYGWDNLDIGVKYRTIVSAPDEFLLSTALIYEAGGTGAVRIGAEPVDTVQPVVSFGRGLGDLPRDLEWLRPAAVAGALGMSLPTAGGTPAIVHYGASLQYSLIYRDQHTGLPTPDWASGLVPLIEFAVDSPAGRSYGTYTTATAGPGIAWIGDKVQLTAEALVPLTSHTGRGIGVITQVHLFLDELVPALFGKPLFSGD